MTRDELLARARAASRRLSDANEELDAAERNHRIAWQEWEDAEDSAAVVKPTSNPEGGK